MCDSFIRPTKTNKNVLTHILPPAQNMEYENTKTRARHFKFNDFFFVATELKAFSIETILKLILACFSIHAQFLSRVAFICIKLKLIIIFFCRIFNWLSSQHVKLSYFIKWPYILKLSSWATGSKTGIDYSRSRVKRLFLYLYLILCRLKGSGIFFLH